MYRSISLLFKVFFIVSFFICFEVFGAFNANDSLKLVNFLNNASMVQGKTNGQQLSTNYNPTNPFTWNVGVWVDDEQGVKRISEISIPNSMLAGSLNLQNCDSLKIVNCDNNSILQLTINNCLILDSLSCKNNSLESLDLSNLKDVRVLMCDSNLISYLDIRDSKGLQYLSCSYNALTFFELLMPVNYFPPTCLIGTQRPHTVTEVESFGISKGLSIDLHTHNAINYHWKYFANGNSVDLTKYTEDNGVFQFDEILIGDTIYCEMVNNVTHPNMIVPTVHFELSYKYNENDVQKIRAFLNQPSSIAAKTNGLAVNPVYNPNDPRTFNVIWNVKTTNNLKEYRLIKIYEWHSTGIAGHIDLEGTKFLNEVVVKNNAITGFTFSDTTNINNIDCSDNLIEVLDLSAHHKLVQLRCQYNAIKTLDFTSNNQLVDLFCNHNQLTDISLTGLINLKELRCDENQITSLDVTDLQNLQRLICDNNQIQTMQTNKLSKLIILSASNNKIDSLDLTDSKDLERLFIKNNNLTYLNLNNLANISHLVCDSNKLDFNSLIMPANTSSIQNITLNPQDSIARKIFKKIGDEWVSKNITVDLSDYISNKDTTYFTWKKSNGIVIHRDTNNGLYRIPDQYDGELIYCELSTKDLYPGLILTTVQFRPRYEYDEHDIVKLREFLDSNSKFGDALNGRTNGKEISMHYISADPSTFPVTWDVIGDKKCLSKIDWSEQKNIKGNIDLSKCLNLKELNVSCSENTRRNAVTNIILDSCIALKKLQAKFNQLEKVSIKYCNELENIDCSNNLISDDIEISSKKIININVSNNKLTNIEINGKPALVYINLNNNKLTELSIDDAPLVVSLECAYNNLSVLNLSANRKLTVLNFGYNRISKIDLSEQNLLQYLNCENNLLDTLNISNCKEITMLKANNNKLSELNLLTIDYITLLDVDNNKLTFTSLKYNKTPNETRLHPQANVRPANLDENNILKSDTLSLAEFGEIEDTPTNYILKYINGDVVPSNLYKLKDGVFSDFSKELKDKTLYGEMTNKKYPGLTLYTVKFNTVKPEKYNYNDVLRLRAILDQKSKNNSITNGKYLTNSYISEEPETFPVTWVAINDEYRVNIINWANKYELSGNVDLRGCAMLDTVIVTGQTNGLNYSEISRIVLENCTNIKYLDASYNSLKNVVISDLQKLNYINLNNNQINTIETNNLPALDTMLCAFNQIYALDLTSANGLNKLECNNNILIFTTTKLYKKPNTFVWTPQALIIPIELTRSGINYKLEQSTVNLKGYGNNVDYKWFNGHDVEIKLIENNGVFHFPDSLEDQFVYCVMTSKQPTIEGATLSTVKFMLDLYDGIVDKTLENSFSVYPNPANEFSTISFIGEDEISSGDILIDLYNTNGEKLATMYSGIFNNTVTVNTANLPNGTYYFQITINNKTIMKKFSVQR